MTKTSKYPKVVVFDLDYTLWPFWCDTHVFLPVKPYSKTQCIDSHGTKLALFPDVESIVLELVENGVAIVTASRTATPNVAKQLLTYLHVDNKPFIDYISSMQWGQGPKEKHIRAAAKALGMEKELADGEFILFDDEGRNRDVESTGCKFAYLIHERLDRKDFEKNIKEWAEWKESR